MASGDFSNYVISMLEEAQRQYVEMLVVEGIGRAYILLRDPYNIDAKLWLNDVTRWPDVQFGDIYTFLIHKTGIKNIELFFFLNYNFSDALGQRISYFHLTVKTIILLITESHAMIMY